MQESKALSILIVLIFFFEKRIVWGTLDKFYRFKWNIYNLELILATWIWEFLDDNMKKNVSQTFKLANLGSANATF